MKIPILMYHMISSGGYAEGGMYRLSPKQFKRQMQYLKKNRYTPITLGDVHKYYSESLTALPQKPVVITFDDGYADNYENAFPVLQDFGFPATVFIVTGYVGKTSAWEEDRIGRALPLLGWREIIEMQKNGISIGSHSVTHRRLSRLDKAEIIREIGVSKQEIEDKLGFSIDHFAYPYGDVSEPADREVQKAGYQTACTTMSGFNGTDQNLFALRRLDIYGTDTLSRFVRKLTYGTNDGSVATSLRYYGRRILERAGEGR
jgi:peptidoglycan/xylan/chitin deacetylase (PgdA/CDA1 family)